MNETDIITHPLVLRQLADLMEENKLLGLFHDKEIADSLLRIKDLIRDSYKDYLHILEKLKDIKIASKL